MSLKFAFISPLNDMNFYFLCRKIMTLEAIFSSDRRKVFNFSQPVRQVTRLASIVEFVQKVYQQNCNKYERYAFNLKDNSCYLQRIAAIYI